MTATTRAADYLILSSGAAQPGSSGGPWTRLLGRRFDLETGRLRVQLPPGYPAPKVKVTTREPLPERSTASGHRRRDLSKLVAQATTMAEQGAGGDAPNIGIVAPDRSARRQYSFSRLAVSCTR